MIEEILPGYDQGVEAAATHLEHLSITTLDKDKDTYLNAARYIRMLKQVENYSDNPYRHTMAVLGIDSREPNVIPLPPAPLGYKWQVLVSSTIWAVCYQEGRLSLIEDLKAALYGYNPTGGIQDALSPPLHHLRKFGVCQVLILDPKQLEGGPLLISDSCWRYSLLESVK